MADPDLSFDDLRDYIARVEDLGELRSLRGAVARHEIGAVTEVAAGLPGCPALLFDEIPGFAKGFRVFSNATVKASRAALALGLDPNLNPVAALRAWKTRRSALRPIPPRQVERAAFFANRMSSAEIDVGRFPSPIWHQTDGGAYIGSGSLVVTRDPETGWVNASIYRVQVHAPARLTIQFDHAGRHGSMISRKYWEKGEACPVAIVCGQDPTLFVAGFEYLPEGYSEYDFAGAIRNRPVDVVEGPLTRLPLPAQAEIVLEGSLLPFPKNQLMEGPFGEFTGYYAADAAPAPVMAVDAAYFRDDPILFGSPPMKPPRFHFGLPLRAATMWSNMEGAGITDVVGVWQHVSQLMTVVAIRQRYAGHAMRAALFAASMSYMGRVVVVVDDDIDPSDLADVMWAVTTRAEPSEDVEIVRNGWSSALDPRIDPARKSIGLTSNSKLLVNACRPFDRLTSYPKAAALPLQEVDAVLAKWSKALA